MEEGHHISVHRIWNRSHFSSSCPLFHPPRRRVRARAKGVSDLASLPKAGSRFSGIDGTKGKYPLYRFFFFRVLDELWEAYCGMGANPEMHIGKRVGDVLKLG